MSRYNTKSVGATKTRNKEGAVAYKESADLDLYSLACTCSLSNKFYETDKDSLIRLKQLVAQNDPYFVAQLAVYCRDKMYLRTVPLVLVNLLTEVHNGDDTVYRATRGCVKRADELLEAIAMYVELFNRGASRKSDGSFGKEVHKVSRQLFKGVRDSFFDFDEYQFGKYDRPTKIKFRDLIRLMRPKPQNDEQSELFQKIIKGTLETPYTWEVELSKLGQEKYETTEERMDAFKAKWEELIDSGKLGYMAILRNLRNILKSGVSRKHVAKVAKMLRDPEQVAKSKQFPFRFYSAYKMIEIECAVSGADVLDALEDAMLASAQNVSGYDEDTRVFISFDNSGSMGSTISEKSIIRMCDVGAVLGSILQNRCKSVITSAFGESFQVIQMSRKAILENADKAVNTNVGHSTNGHLALEYLIREKVEVDKVMIFSDMQLWDSSSWYSDSSTFKKAWTQYKKDVNPKAKLYLFDLAGYGNTPIETHAEDVYLIAGWSDKIFDILEAIDSGNAKSAIEEIKKVDL